MEPNLLALADRIVPGPIDPDVALVSFIASVALTALVAWWAEHLTRDRTRRRTAELAESVPVGGVH
jgi:hypothetical protein